MMAIGMIFLKYTHLGIVTDGTIPNLMSKVDSREQKVICTCGMGQRVNKQWFSGKFENKTRQRNQHYHGQGDGERETQSRQQEFIVQNHTRAKEDPQSYIRGRRHPRHGEDALC